MAFVVKREVVVWWPVSVHVPMDNGKTSTSTFSVQYRLLPSTKISELGEVARAAVESGDSEPTIDVLILRESIQDWKEVKDEENEPVSFSMELLNDILSIPYVRPALWNAYVAVANGQKAEKK